MELLNVDSASLGCWDNVHRDDVERPGSNTVPGRHVTVACGDSIGLCQFTVFTVHVVGSGSRVVPESDSVVFNGAWSLLRDFVHRHDLADSRLDLLQPTEEVPSTVTIVT